MFCVMLMSWWLGGPLEDMRQVKLYLIHTSSHCCCWKLELDFQVVLQVQVDKELIVFQTLPLFGWDSKADLDISNFLSYIFSYSTLFWGHSFAILLENTQAWCSRMWPSVLTPLFFTTSPSPSPLSKGQGHGPLISPYPSPFWLPRPDPTSPPCVCFGTPKDISHSTCHCGPQPAFTHTPWGVLKGEPRVPGTL